MIRSAARSAFRHRRIRQSLPSIRIAGPVDGQGSRARPGPPDSVRGAINAAAGLDFDRGS